MQVKQILDKPRCKTLQESDLLQEINANQSKDMVFDQISQVINQVLDNK